MVPDWIPRLIQEQDGVVCENRILPRLSLKSVEKRLNILDLLLGHSRRKRSFPGLSLFALLNLLEDGRAAEQGAAAHADGYFDDAPTGTCNSR